MGNGEMKRIGLSTYINHPDIKSMIAKTFQNPARERAFATSTVIALGNNPALAECTPISLITCALQGENLHLNPTTQDFYIVPFKDKKKGVVGTFIVGYKGYVRLALRSGKYKKIIVSEVKDGEFISWDRFTEEFRYNPLPEEDRALRRTVGYYAYFQTLDGFTKAMYWTIEQMERHADRYSKAFSLKSYRDLQEGKIPQQDLWKYSSFWYKDFDEMAKKTMIRQLLTKWGELTPELTQALESDGAAIENDSGTLKPVYIDTTAEDVEPTAEAEPTQIPAPVPDMPEQTEEPEDIGLDDL